MGFYRKWGFTHNGILLAWGFYMQLGFTWNWFLHTRVLFFFTRKVIYTQWVLHQMGFDTQWRFSRNKILHGIGVMTRNGGFTRNGVLHVMVFFYTHLVLHARGFTNIGFCTQWVFTRKVFLHAMLFYTKLGSTRIEVLYAIVFYTQGGFTRNGVLHLMVFYRQ